MQECRWHSVTGEPGLRQAAVEAVLSAAARAIRQRGRFHLVLAGASTPRETYRALRGARADWPAWHIHFGDERRVPPDDPARNSWMAAQAWLDAVPVPPPQVHEEKKEGTS